MDPRDRDDDSGQKEYSAMMSHETWKRETEEHHDERYETWNFDLLFLSSYSYVLYFLAELPVETGETNWIFMSSWRLTHDFHMTDPPNGVDHCYILNDTVPTQLPTVPFSAESYKIKIKCNESGSHSSDQKGLKETFFLEVYDQRRKILFKDKEDVSSFKIPTKRLLDHVLQLNSRPAYSINIYSMNENGLSKRNYSMSLTAENIRKRIKLFQEMIEPTTTTTTQVPTVVSFPIGSNLMKG